MNRFKNILYVISDDDNPQALARAVLGNTAETVLSQLDCAVLAVKPDGFISTIKNH